MTPDMNKTMQKSSLAALLLLSAAALPCCGNTPAVPENAEAAKNEESYVRKTDMGLAAIRERDFRTAAEFFRRAREKAESPAEFSAAAQQEGDALLKAGDIAGAEKLLALWDQRYPGNNSAGKAVLRGEILAGKNSYAEAEKFLSSFIQGRVLSGRNYFLLSELLALSRFRQGKYAQAAADYEALEKLEKGSALEFPVWQQALRSLYAMKDFAAAEKKLAAGEERFKLPEQRRTVAELHMLGELLKGDLKAFEELWEKSGNTDKTGRKDALFFEICLLAGEKLQQSAPERAEEFYRTAFNSAVNEAGEKQSMLALADLLEKNGKFKECAECLDKYLSFYPKSRDFVEHQLRAADMYDRGGNPERALELFRLAVESNAAPMKQKHYAMKRRGQLLLAGGRTDQAVFEINALIDRSRGREKFENRFLLGQILYLAGRFHDAAAAFKSSRDMSFEPEQSDLWRMHSLIAAGNYPAALEAAAVLGKSKNEKYQASGEYFNALILEKSGETAAARQAYEAFIKKYSSGEFLAPALYAAAGLAAAEQDYSAAERLYRDFAEKFSSLPDADVAAYQAFRNACAGEDSNATARALSMLKTKFPQSAYTTAALFHRFDHLRTAAEYDEAGKVLDEIAALRRENPPAELLSQLMLDRASLCRLKNDSSGEKSLLTALLEKYPDGENAAEAALRLGDHYFDRGDYAGAIEMYRKGLLQADGWQKQVLMGRLADGLYSFSADNPDAKLLTEAGSIYRELSRMPGSVGIKFQSLYKLGKVQEFSGENAEALKLYKEVLYLAAAEKKNGTLMLPENRIWTGKALHSALNLLAQRGSSAAAGREIVRLIKLFQSLGFEDNEDFTPMLDAVKKRYRL